MDVSNWINIVGFITVSCVGTVFNALFSWSLFYSKNIRHALGTSFVLVAARALNDFLTCSMAIPLSVWGMFGPVIPKEGSIMCTLSHRLFYSFTHASMWLTCSLAACRVLAVYAPHFYRKHINRRPAIMATLASFSVLLAFSTTIIGLPAQWYVIRPNTSGTCYVYPVNDTPAAISMFKMFTRLEILKGTWIPLPLGMGFYALVYARLYWNKRRQLLHLQPVISVPVGQQRQVVPLAWLSGARSGNVVAATASASYRAVTAAAKPGTSAVNASALEPLPQPLFANNTSPAPPTSSQTDLMLSKVRLLFMANVVDLVLMLPNQLMFALGLFLLPGFNTQWVLAALHVLYASASTLNLWVYVVMSNQIRQEYRRVFCSKAASVDASVVA